MICTCVCVQVIWKRLYDCSSAKDVGTLYHLRCLINRRNVVKKPDKSVTACEEFFLLVVEAHICSAAIKLFDMKSLDDVPSSKHFPENCKDLPPDKRWTLMNSAIKGIIKT